MIRIITGKIDCGKTTRLLSLYEKEGKGDGFAIRKIYEDGKHIGQEVYWLSKKEKVILSLFADKLPKDWDELCSFGPYRFSVAGFQFARNIILEAINKGYEPLYLDEIGPLELSERGFFSIFTYVLESEKEATIAVRESCLQEIIKKFQIEHYQIMMI